MAAGGALSHRVEFGGGLVFPLQEDHKEIFGPAAGFNVGYAARFGERRWLTLETGLTTAAGDLGRDDPTFEAPVRYWLMPFNLGIRGMAGEAGNPVRFGLGIAFQSALAWQKRPNGSTRPTAVTGLLVDVRPEIPLGPRWTLWFRQRLALLSRSSRGDDNVDHSAAHTQVGFSFGNR